jgi:hypothetical protein
MSSRTGRWITRAALRASSPVMLPVTPNVMAPRSLASSTTSRAREELPELEMLMTRSS